MTLIIVICALLICKDLYAKHRFLKRELQEQKDDLEKYYELLHSHNKDKKYDYCHTTNKCKRREELGYSINKDNNKVITLDKYI